MASGKVIEIETTESRPKPNTCGILLSTASNNNVLISISVAGQWQPSPSRVTRGLPGVHLCSSAALAHYLINARRLLTALRGSS